MTDEQADAENKRAAAVQSEAAAQRRLDEQRRDSGKSQAGKVKVVGVRAPGALNVIGTDGKPAVVQHSVNMPVPNKGDTIEIVELRQGDTLTGLAYHPQPKNPA
jgi:hypothetical protein